MKIKYEYFYIITITDLFTRWSEVVVIYDISSETIKKKINEKKIKKFKAPLKILKIKEDNIYQWTSRNFYKLIKYNKLHHQLTIQPEIRFRNALIRQ